MKKEDNKMTWKEVTLQQYLAIQDVLETNKGDEMEKALAYLKILYGKDYSIVPIGEYLEKVKELKFLQDDIPTVDLPKRIIVNGREYRVCGGADDLTTAQFMDYMNFSKSDAKDKIIDIVATFIVPIDAKVYGEGYDYEVVRKDAGDMPLVIANSIGFFLQKQMEKSLRRTLHYSIFQIMTMKGMTMKNKLKMIKGMVTLYQTMESYRTFSPAAK